MPLTFARPALAQAARLAAARVSATRDRAARLSPARLSIARLPAPLLLAAALLLAAVPMAPARAAEPANPIGGVRFDPQVQLGGQPLLLNGTGLRAILFFKGYAAALYLAQRASTADAVVAMAGAKRLQMRLLLDVQAAEFIKAFRVGMERNLPPDEQASLADRAARFEGLLKPLGEFKKGDAVNLDFVPGQGLLFWLNGRQVGTAIPGEDFYGGLLRVFVGEKVSDDKLRAGLLGKS